jgi:hypothetical protein
VVLPESSEQKANLESENLMKQSKGTWRWATYEPKMGDFPGMNTVVVDLIFQGLQMMASPCNSL